MQFNHTSHVSFPTRSKYGFSPSSRSRKFSSQWSRRLWFISGDLFGLDFRMLIARNRRNQHNETDHQLVESGRGNPVTISHYNAAIRASGAHRWPGRAFLDGRIGECIRSGTRRRGMSWPFFFCPPPAARENLRRSRGPDRDVCTHRALRLPSYINVNAAGYRRARGERAGQRENLSLLLWRRGKERTDRVRGSDRDPFMISPSWQRRKGHR